MGESTAGRIDVADLTFRYPGTSEPVLDGANLEIDDGEFVAVLGGNGSGKTTLCKAFNGIVPHFYEGSFDGEVTVAGMDTTAATVADLSKHVGYVFQEFDNQLVNPTVFDEVAFGPINYGRADYRERVERALDVLDLSALADRFVWELSGGQKHLVALAAALSMEPSILVVDEPAAQLDPVHARETYEYLARLNDDHGKTVVVIEHNTEFVAEYCESVALVEDGSVSWKAPVETALNRLSDLRRQDVHPPQVTRVAEGLNEQRPYPVTLETAVERFRHRTSSTATATAPAESGDERSGRSAGPQDAAAPVVSVDGVAHGYRTLNEGRTVVFEDLSIDCGAGERIALLGGNGAGKSTLLRLLTGIETPEAGTVTVAGIETSDALPERVAEEVVYVHQNPEEMFIADSVRADVAHYLRSRDVDDAERRVDEVIDFLDLGHLADRDGRLLSVGQQRRASLAIGLATDPSIVLLDEPTGSLDLASRERVGETIDRAGERVETVLVATHDLELAAAWATRVIVLDGGEVVADGDPRTVFGAVDVLRSANLRPPQVARVSEALDLSPVALTPAELADRLGQRSASRAARPEGPG